MNEIYVTGHRNPDTDSIVASIAYANLRNSLGDREYKAVRIGGINDETQNMLRRFGFDAPELIRDMRNQICDLDFDRPPLLNLGVPLDLAWQQMREGSFAAIPIVHDNNTLYGMLSSGDVAEHDLETIYNSFVDKIPVFNLVSVLEGRLVNELSNTASEIAGHVHVALPKAYDDVSMFLPDSIII